MGARLFTARVSGAESVQLTSGPTVPTFRRGREAAALLLFACSVFLLLALGGLRKDPAVPSLTGADWVGPVGATVAGFLAGGFGLVAWLVPVELGLVALPMFRGSRDGSLPLRSAGDLVIGIVLSALVQVALPELLVFGRLPAGGNVGLLFGELMRGLFSDLGSYLVGATVVGLILIGRSSFSFLECCHSFVRVTSLGFGRSKQLLLKLRDAWTEARRLRRECREAERAHAEPRIDHGTTDEAIIAKLEADDQDWIPTEESDAAPLALAAQVASGPGPTTALIDAATTPEPRFAVPPPAAEAAAPVEGAPLDVPIAAILAPEPTPALPATPAPTASLPQEPRIVDTLAEQHVERVHRSGRARHRAAFKLPPTDLLNPAPPSVGEVDKPRLLENAALLEKTLADYGVSGKVEEISRGPTVSTYEVVPAAGTKVSKVASLTDDLALALSRKVRIIAPIPGKSRIGFEVPNDERSMVYLRDLVEDSQFAKLAEHAPLPVVLGRDIVGRPYYADLASMPHLIVAGATGAGKSVGINVMLASLLFYRSPEDLRFLMIDPKVVELAPYDRIPHMLLPVVTDMKQAATALRWAVDEMERRYQLFADAHTKNIVTYNRWVAKVAAGELPAPSVSEVSALTADGAVVSVPAAKEGSDGVQLPGKLPYIVVVVDEFSDLMMQGGKDVEAAIARLAQKARAAGLHVILATQRPSVDVITGMIKANFPSRIAYRVAQRVDSSTILDEKGAELLLGSGDMLVKTNGGEIRRIQCPFITEEEVAALTDHLRRQGAPQYHEAILAAADEEDGDGAGSDEAIDPRFDEAVRIVADTQRCSTSWLQRKMTIGYNRAAKMVEMMEKRGIVGPPNGARDREVLVSPL
jgi:DNA segregation ATPase FtsK/SpoIIIE, S-DNA-T family